MLNDSSVNISLAPAGIYHLCLPYARRSALSLLDLDTCFTLQTFIDRWTSVLCTHLHAEAACLPSGVFTFRSVGGGAMF